jgi:hypothetical protein
MSVAHLNPKFRRHGDISAVEQRVNILPEQDAAAKVVRPILREWPNVPGIWLVPWFLAVREVEPVFGVFRVPDLCRVAIRACGDFVGSVAPAAAES